MALYIYNSESITPIDKQRQNIVNNNIYYDNNKKMSKNAVVFLPN